MEDRPFFRFLSQRVLAQAEVPGCRSDGQAAIVARQPADECVFPMGWALPSRLQDSSQGGPELKDLLQL